MKPITQSEATIPVPRKTLELINSAMNYMGDVLNNMDAVEEEDENRTTEAFEAIQSLLSATIADEPAQPTAATGMDWISYVQRDVAELSDEIPETEKMVVGFDQLRMIIERHAPTIDAQKVANNRLDVSKILDIATKFNLNDTGEMILFAHALRDEPFCQDAQKTPSQMTSDEQHLNAAGREVVRASFERHFIENPVEIADGGIDAQKVRDDALDAADDAAHDAIHDIIQHMGQCDLVKTAVSTAIQSLKSVPAAPVAQAVGSSKDAEDATNWRALLSSARIRPLGSAGLTSDTNPNGDPYNGYAHLGLELWTIFGKSLDEDGRERLAKENALGHQWLTKYVEIAASAQGGEG